MTALAYHRPRRLDDALRLARTRPGARFVAGGTDLLVGMRIRPATLVSLRNIPELRGVDGTRLGALTTVGDLIRDETLARDYPLLVAAARRLGSAQIRNQATLGGNLCRAAPCADLAPPLLAYEARVEIAREGGTRNVPLTAFFRGPGVTCLEEGEVVTAVHVEPPRPTARGVFLKKGRVRVDLSLASVAVLLEAEGLACRRVRIAAGSVAPTPVRLPEVEAWLTGRDLDDATLREAGSRAAAGVLPIDDVRATAAYRRRLVEVYVRRGLAAALAAGGAP